ncbi:6-bladed beta-propeller [Kaarinaea lacus]
MLNRVSLALLLSGIYLLLSGCVSDGGPVDFEPPVFPPPPEKPRFIWERTFTSSLNVREATAMDKFKQFATGTGASAEGIAKPFGVAVYQGRVYVSDTVERNVSMFDVPGRDFKKIGIEGPGTLTKPIGVAVNRNDGTLYVVDITAKRVVVYDKDGNYLRAIGGTEVFHRPTSAALSPDGLTLWVVDNGGVDSQAHHLYKFDAISGDLIQTIGTRGKEQGQFNLPLQAETAPDGTVYVVDGGNFRVQAFNPDGTFKLAFGAIGRKSGQFSRPKGIGVGPDGNVYVTDANFANFQIFNSQGELLLFIGDRSFKGGPAAYILPADITVDEDGRIYVADQYYRKVDVFRPYELPEDAGYLSAPKLPPPK